jgi:hypothetical protein
MKRSTLGITPLRQRMLEDMHQLAIHRRGLEVEARQVAVDRELRRAHLAAHRARGPVSFASALSICSISQRERASSALFYSVSSDQVAAMPCSRSAFSYGTRIALCARDCTGWPACPESTQTRCSPTSLVRAQVLMRQRDEVMHIKLESAALCIC